MKSRKLWMIPTVVMLGFSVAVGVYAVTRPDPPPAAVETGHAQYPQADFALVSGDGKGLVTAYCTACHSLAPIVHHSGFTAEQWAAEVDKMRNNYGAPIDDETAAKITSYLQEHYTVPMPQPRGTAGEPFSEPKSD